MKLLNWINQRLGKRPPLPVSIPQFTGERNADVDRLAVAILGVLSWNQAYLEIITSMRVTAATEAEAAQLNEQNADVVKQIVEGMSAALHEWGDWLSDPSRPTPAVPMASLNSVLSTAASNAD